MEITEVRVFPVNDEERLKAYATITIDYVFLIRDLRVINGKAGLFVAMPSCKMKDGSFKDIAHPLNSETSASWPILRSKSRRRKIPTGNNTFLI